MMGSQRHGFTLVELLVVMVIGALLLGAAYQTLSVQQRGYRSTGAIIGDQDALRVALNILETEIRETATSGGVLIGSSDISMATADSVTIRASRKIGIVCGLSPSDKSMIVWSEWELFTAEDSLLIFVDVLPTTYIDDRWEAAKVSNANSSTATCDTKTPGAAQQKVILVAHPLTGVLLGAPVRSFERVTYGLYEFDDGWGLGRKTPDDETPRLLVGGLAGAGEGLILEYLDAAGSVTTDLSAIVSVRISLTTEAQPSTGAPQKSLASIVYLRNN